MGVDGCSIHIIMKTICPPGYRHNGFVVTHALGDMMIYIYIYICLYILYIYEYNGIYIIEYIYIYIYIRSSFFYCPKLLTSHGHHILL